MKILLTGWTGFIGAELLGRAISAGHEVTCLGREWTQGHFIAKIQWKEYDAVIHLAAAGVKRERRDWGECMEVNVHAFRRFLTALHNSGANPIVIMTPSSRENEADMVPALWADPYIVSKKMASRFAWVWALAGCHRIISVPISSCYAPGEVEKVAERILTALTEPLTT